MLKPNSAMRMHPVSFLASILTLALIQSCSVDQTEIRAFLEESVEECNGDVRDVSLAREGPFTGRFYGFATVVVDGKEYTPELTAVSDGSSIIIKLEQNVCAIHGLQNFADELQRDLNNLNF
jgi:hypothetical protein